MQGKNTTFDVEIYLQINPVDNQYFQLSPRIDLPQESAHKFVRESYIIFIIELRTGIKTQDLGKIRNYFLGLCENVIENGLKGISFIINGQHHIVKNHKMEDIRELLQRTFTISLEDDYSKTLIKTRHAIQNIADRLDQTKISLIFFFSHLEIDHSLGKKKISYIDYLNQHADTCLEQVKHLAKSIKRFTDECKTFIISYDKNGQEQTDYSLCDTDLMNQINMYVGNWGSMISRNYSYTQLGSAFQNVAALVMFKMYTLSIIIPTRAVQHLGNQKQKKRNQKVIHLQYKNFMQFKTEPFFIKRQLLDTTALKNNGIMLQSNSHLENLQDKVGILCAKTKVNYFELQGYQLLIAQAKVCSLEIAIICRTISEKIVSYRRRYYGGKSELIMDFDKDLFLQMRDKLEFYYERSKQIFTEIQSIKKKGQSQINAYEAYTELKRKIDGARAILTQILKKQIGGSEIGKLSQLINLDSIKNSLRNKLLKRINANPFLLGQVYDTVQKIVDGGTIDYFKNEVDSGELRFNLGNCIITDYNFVKAMKEYDALGVAFQIERPMSAIADPGRIKIRQISPYLMRVSSFFQKFLYKIQYSLETIRMITPRLLLFAYNSTIKQAQSLSWNQNPSENTYYQDLAMWNFSRLFFPGQIDYLRKIGGLQKQNYKERCDYADRAQKTQTVLGFMPLFLTEDHWKIAKLLMKPCLAFTATSEPLGYLFSQYQTIPFIVLSSAIRSCKQIEYKIQQKCVQVQKMEVKPQNKQKIFDLRAQIKIMQKKLVRMKHLCDAIESTCRAILLELSTQKFETPLLATINKKYEQYKDPLNRTIDVISNNSSFLSQLYLAFKNGLLNKPSPKEFDYFFVRLIQEELRRQTDGWNEQETQDAFLDKLLNLDAQKIKKQKQKMVIMMDEQSYASKFQKAREGQSVNNAMIQIQRQQLELMMTKGGKFNDNQRLLLIQYKRLYENKVLWMWYVRFLLYGEMQRVAIHKWKCLGLTNSYMLFTLIIQNKKQRKNYKRREAITNGEYADPFNYQEARQYLQNEFSSLYSKILNGMAQEVKSTHASNAAEAFSVTQNLEEAAGVLLNCHDLYSKIFEALLDNKVPLLADKLEMLLKGSYQGVYLFEGWKMSKKKTNKLRIKHKYQFSRYQYRF